MPDHKEKTQPVNKLYLLYLAGFLLVLALPLLNLPPWFSPPDWGKTIVFRVVVAVLAFLFVWQALSFKNDIGENQRFNRRNPAFIPFLLLIVLFIAFLLATVFSLDINFSLWGSPYRAGGFVNLVFYFIFCLLAFFIIRNDDWQKLWDFAIFIGLLVSLIAVFQQFGLFKELFVAVPSRPPSTIGGPIFLAIYLMLLSFLILSFGLNEKRLFKKLFYLLATGLFLFVIIFISQTRAAYLGLSLGFLWFFFGYPRKLVFLKVLLAIFLLAAILGFYLLKTRPEIYASQSNFIKMPILRILSISEGDPSRFSSWKIAWQALIERPPLGYGPENFSIGFDKYYQPTLPGLKEATPWWDRAHNFVFDIGATAGIPTLIIYLSLFGVLFWQLQKLKAAEKYADNQAGQRRIIVAHGIQATFIAYFVANFFSFDTFSSYLILFLLIAYSLHLLSKQGSNEASDIDCGFTPFRNLQFLTGRRIYADIVKRRETIVFLLFIGLIWFIWEFNFKPFKLNTEINVARYSVQKNQCRQALNRMEKILPQKSILDSYLRLKYIDFIKDCADKLGGQELALGQKGYQLLKENIILRPYFTRNWLLLGEFTNLLIEKETDPTKKTGLIAEANEDFKTAENLSPKRPEVLFGWITADLLSGNYQEAVKKSERCLNLDPELGACYWFMALSQIFFGEPAEISQINIDKAKALGYRTDLFPALSQLAKAYATVKNYPELIKVYQQLVILNPTNPQYHAQLAFAYRELGQYEQAKQEALKVLELLPGAKEEVEEFLKTLY